MQECPSDDQLARHLDLELPADDERAVRSHVAACTACEARLARRLNAIGAGGDGLELMANLDRTVLSPQRPERGPVSVIVPDYDLVRHIGGGGFGEVWLARQRLTDAFYAVKIIRRTATRTHESAVGTFICEQHVRPDQVELDGVRRYLVERSEGHPNLVRVLHVGAQPGFYYYVMEAADDARGSGVQAPPEGYVAYTLTEHLSRQGPLALSAAVAIVRQLLAGLNHLHQFGLLHRDVKPANVIRRGGIWKLGDVGLVAEQRLIFLNAGTPAYAPHDGVHDRSGDLYCVGVTLAELLSGDSPSPGPRDGLLQRATERGGENARRVLDRACASDRAARFQRCEEFVAALDALTESSAAPTQSPAASPITRDATPTRSRRRVAGVAIFAIAAVCAVVWLRLAPAPDSGTVLARFNIPRSPGEWSPVGNPDRSMQHYARIAGQPLPAGAIECALPADVASFEAFAFDFRIRAHRPWGTLVLELASEQTGGTRFRVQFEGQPDGVGLTTTLFVDDAGEKRAAQSPIRGHPQPGVEYIVRMAREPESIALAVWPLARAAGNPLILRVATQADAAAPRFLTVNSGTDDALAAIDIMDGCVLALKGPLKRIDDPGFLPDAIARRAAGAVLSGVVPEIDQTTAPPSGELLTGRFHPYVSGAWNALGPWAWWSGCGPDPPPNQKPIRCMPFASGDRADLREASDYAGAQILRFDAGIYRDFDARVHITLAQGSDPESHRPFVYESERGTVGIAFHLQDDAPAGAAWGGGQWAGVSLSGAHEVPPIASITRFGGLVLGRDRDAHFALTPLPTQTFDSAAEISRDELLNPDGFTLRLRVRGRRAQLFLNDRAEPIAERDESLADALTRGRVGLIAVRLIATFDSFEVTPVNSSADENNAPGAETP